MPTYNPGELVHRVYVQEKVSVAEDSDLGTPQDEWTNVDEDPVWCSYADRGRVPGDEAFRGQQVSPEVTGKIRLRYWSHPETGARLGPVQRLVGAVGTELADRTFEIIAVTNPGERGATTLMDVFVVEQP